MITIDPKVCTGCQACMDVCPCDVIRFHAKREVAYPAYSRECWYCGACVEQCPVDAIALTFQAFRTPPVTDQP